MEENKKHINNKKKKKKVKKHPILKIVLLVILLILLIIIGYFVIGTIKNGGGKEGFVATALGQSQEDIKNLEPFSALILGSSQNMTDTIMVFKYNPQTQKAYLISIPRDTFVGTVKTSAKASDKINSLYQGQYPEKTLAAVNKVTNLNLKYYIVVDTDALKALVDTIGGVYFDVPMDMKYTDKKQNLYIDLQKGYQLLDGNKAEQVVRFRHNQDGTTYSADYGDNDIGRMKTQRNFLTAVIKQTLKVENIAKIGSFVDIAQTYIKTNVPMDTIKSYIAPAVNFNTDNLQTGTLPGIPEKCNGVWLFICDKTKAIQFFSKENKKLLNIEDVSTKDLSNIKVEILNGSGKSQNLTKVKKSLTEAGFTVTRIGNTNSTQKTSIINKSQVSEDILSYIKDILQTGEITSSNSESTSNIKIILGKDINQIK